MWSCLSSKVVSFTTYIDAEVMNLTWNKNSLALLALLAVTRFYLYHWLHRFPFSYSSSLPWITPKPWSEGTWELSAGACWTCWRWGCYYIFIFDEFPLHSVHASSAFPKRRTRRLHRSGGVYVVTAPRLCTLSASLGSYPGSRAAVIAASAL